MDRHEVTGRYAADTERRSQPRPTLSVLDGVAIVIGIVIGSAIFQTPSMVAANIGTPTNLLLVWILGAGISIAGALCYAELASTYPHAGGEYHYLTRAWGPNVGFLFAWARVSVIQTGSIALIAYVFGDYASQIFDIGKHSAAFYAAGAVGILTLLHLAGIALSKQGQRWLSGAQIAGLLLLIASGFFLSSSSGVRAVTSSIEGLSSSGFGVAMVFVLLSYGGWNEASFISSELREPKRNMLRVLVISVVFIGTVYVLLNYVMLQRLGIDQMAQSDAVGAALMREVAGDGGATLVSLLVIACALASINAMIFTGARTSYALGRDFGLFSALGRWETIRSVPSVALAVQGVVILLLIGFGAWQRKGFETMVSYTAPAFWLFFLLTTLSLFRLRRSDPHRERGFSVPLYPLTPLLFAVVCLYLLYSSVMYTGVGAFVGLAVVAAGTPFLLARRGADRPRRLHDSEADCPRRSLH
jgi:basic amino acid/polyamine antiporter, APA family